MFCPRCGAPNPDTTKFCRQCGLGLQPVTGYVASGGTASLQQPPQPPQPQLGTGDLISRATAGMTPKQQMILLIMLMAFSPAIFGTLGLGTLSGISAVLMPIGIVFTVMRFKAQQRRLREAMMAQQMYAQQMQPQMMQPPVAPYGLPQPGQPPVPQNYQPPVYQQPASPPTNPLGKGSVTEDDTRRLPDQR